MAHFPVGSGASSPPTHIPGRPQTHPDSSETGLLHCVEPLAKVHDSLAVGSSKPSVKTEFHLLTDYIAYAMTVRENDFEGKSVNDNGDVVPDLDTNTRVDKNASKRENDFDSQTEENRIGPHPEDYLDPRSTFHYVSYRTNGSPLGIRTENENEPLLTSSLSECSSVWLTAKNEAGEDGIHSLFHIYRTNQDIISTIKNETDSFKEKGYTKLEDAQVTGASIDQAFYATPQPQERLKEAADIAKSLVNAVSKLGYKNIVDNTRKNRPAYITRGANVGGIKLKVDGQVRFKPIGRGIFFELGNERSELLRNLETALNAASSEAM